MRAGGAAVVPADDNMRVHGRLALVQGDIAGQCEHLDLLLEEDRAIVLRLPVEIAELDLAESTDTGEARRRKLELTCELGQQRHRLVAGLENEDPAAAPISAQLLRSHKRVLTRAWRPSHTPTPGLAHRRPSRCPA